MPESHTGARRRSDLVPLARGKTLLAGRSSGSGRGSRGSDLVNRTTLPDLCGTMSPWLSCAGSTWGIAVRWKAPGATTLAIACAVAAGVSYFADRIHAVHYTSPPRFGTATVHPEFGPGVNSDLQGARIAKNGTLQVVATGGRCAAATDIRKVETAKSIRVRVRVAGVPQSGGCAMIAIPWFVDVHLDAPLGSRTLVDDTTGQKLQAADCTTVPRPSRGLCVAAPASGP